MRNSSNHREGPPTLLFKHVLPSHRLGKAHASLDEFRKACSEDFIASKQKEYTLIMVTDSDARRILLGKKHRGFGKGMYNSFGGKVEPGEDITASAVRELQEETGIRVPLPIMTQSRLGTLHFTFADSDTEMVVYLFRVHVCFTLTKRQEEKEVAPRDPDDVCNDENVAPPIFHMDISTTIRGCEEITPVWFDDWNDIPLDNMFADDSVWLTSILSASSSSQRMKVDGWFHFCAGGQETNSILHHYLDLRTNKDDGLVNGVITSSRDPNADEDQSDRKQYSLEKRLFHALHNNKVHSPSIKEFKEAFAYTNAVRSVFGSKSSKNKKNAFDYVIDVAGGHGALAALFLITSSSAKRGTVIDPANVGGGGVLRAWGDFLGEKELRYRYECLSTGLPAELDRALELTTSDRILVVACHACQHLSDQVLEICCRRGVHVAVMPCCQKDPSGSSWKATSKKLGIPIATTMDLLLAGKCMSWTTGEAAKVSYDVRMKLIDQSITPQNRIIVCRALPVDSEIIQRQESQVAKAQRKLEVAYRRAHAPPTKWPKSLPSASDFRGGLHFSSGLVIGIVLALAFLRR